VESCHVNSIQLLNNKSNLFTCGQILLYQASVKELQGIKSDFESTIIMYMYNSIHELW